MYGFGKPNILGDFSGPGLGLALVLTLLRGHATSRSATMRTNLSSPVKIETAVSWVALVISTPLIYIRHINTDKCTYYKNDKYCSFARSHSARTQTGKLNARVTLHNLVSSYVSTHTRAYLFARLDKKKIYAYSRQMKDLPKWFDHRLVISHLSRLHHLR